MVLHLFQIGIMLGSKVSNRWGSLLSGMALPLVPPAELNLLIGNDEPPVIIERLLSAARDVRKFTAFSLKGLFS